MIRAAMLMVAVIASIARGEDWPKWLGPRGDNVVRGENLPDQLPEEPKQLWKVEVGVGYSSAIALKGRVYYFGMIDKNKDTLFCIDAEKGKVIWQQAYDGGYTGSYKGTRATPTIDGERIYTYGGNADLVCRKLETGEEVWHINVLKDTGGKNQGWGTSSSPQIIGDVIYVAGGTEGGHAVVAVDKNTGKYVWKSEAKGGGYATIIPAEVEGSKQLVALGNKQLFGINAADGKTIWTQDWETQYDVNASTPIFSGGYVFVSTDYNKGCVMLKLSAKGAEKVFENKAVEARYQPSILDDGYLYANSEGVIKCLKWPEGTVKWQVKESGLVGNGGTILKADDRLIILSDRGKLTLAKVTPEKLQKQGSAEVVEGREIWASPLLYNGRLYVKGMSELVCVELK